MKTIPPILPGLAVLLLGLTPVTQAQVSPVSNSLPDQQVVTAGRSVSFLAYGVTGSVQWQSSATGVAPWTNLADDATYQGAATASLEITNVPGTWEPRYYRFTSSAGGITTFSNVSRLVVSPLLLPEPAGIITDHAGGLLVADATNNIVVQISSAREVGQGSRGGCTTTIIAGVPNVAPPEVSTSNDTVFNQPNGIVAEAPGVPILTVGVLVADSAKGVIQELKGYSSRILAGSRTEHGNVDGPGVTARFGMPKGIAQALDGTYYVTDSTNHTIRKMTADGLVSTFAGSPGNAGEVDDIGGAARFNTPTGIAVDANGIVYVADTKNNVIRRITPAGAVTTLAGLPGVAGAQDGTGTQALFNGPTGLTIGGGGHLYVADTGNSTIREIIPASGSVTTFAGVPTISGFRDGGAVEYDPLPDKQPRYYSDALFNHPEALTYDSVGGLLFVADTGNAAIRVFTVAYGDVTGTATLLLTTAAASSPAVVTPPTVTPPTPPPSPAPASSASSSGGGALSGEFIAALSGLGLLRFRRRLKAVFLRVRRGVRSRAMNFPRRTGSVLCALMLTVVQAFSQAGPSQPINVNPDMQNVTEGRNTRFTVTGPTGAIQWQISTDGHNFTDLAESSVCVGTTTKTLELVGVTGAMGNSLFRVSSTVGGLTIYSYTGKLTVSPLRFPMPAGIAMDNLEQLYISDEATHTVFKGLVVPIDTRPAGLPLHLTLSPLAGRIGEAGFADGTGTGALFSHPAGVAVNPTGVVTLADSANGTLRQISTTGVVSTLAGDSANRGNIDGAGAAARFATPRGITRSTDGSYFVADADNHTIRKVTADGIVTTFAGSPGNAGTADGAGSVARFNHPEGIAVDNSGTVYVADTANNTIRQITATGVVSTFAGIPGVAGAMEGPPNQATFNAPSGVAVSGDGGMLFVADSGNSTIRLLWPKVHRDVSVWAGTPTVSGMSDGYTGMLDHPKAIAVDGSTDYYQIRVFIADTGNAAIRQASWDSGLETLLLREGADAPPPAPPVPLVSGPPPGVAPPPPAASTRSDSGGGGAPSGSFFAALAGLWLLRRLVGGAKPAVDSRAMSG